MKTLIIIILILLHVSLAQAGPGPQMATDGTMPGWITVISNIVVIGGLVAWICHKLFGKDDDEENQNENNRSR